MTTQAQLLAVSKGVKAGTNRAITDAHQRVMKPALLVGLTRTYQPKDDEGERLPAESTKVQYTAAEALDTVKTALVRLVDVTASIDTTNCGARADIIVGAGTTPLAADVPVSTLLFLEKQLVDLHTIVAKLPVLDPAETWTWSPNAGHYAADAVQTTRTKKVPRNHVKAPATDKHPAQVEVYTEDLIVGTWTTLKFSGALPAADVKAMLARMETLQEAVKFARGKANTTVVTDVHVGESLLSYVFDRG